MGLFGFLKGKKKSSEGSADYPRQDGGYPQQQQQQFQQPPQEQFGQPQGYPQPGYAPEGYAQQGYPQQGYPPQGHPEHQGYPQDPGFPQQQFQGYPPHEEHRQIDNVDRNDSACQYQFKPDEETYRCLDCEITEDCPVLCRNCFEASEHKNHRWEMLRDEGGGWCDCGDGTAWRQPFVFCQFHAPKYEQPQQDPGMPYPVAGGDVGYNASYGNPPPYGQQY
ncbi:Oidioi.mRNA.OKI2018_I69.XSR.g13563.t1.cds [Oikopleura dioica]|uniref:E3 ubiquitin-protein ligase n=1 Tax=Oikopleura dioica TaxID=34765 RepID=A0ABN7SAZ5_OIKDI|nr:Oidioi.mRNA.OKI2018_I69.XSR.g13563.t1.cds [Oikopleura dioica]